MYPFAMDHIPRSALTSARETIFDLIGNMIIFVAEFNLRRTGSFDGFFDRVKIETSSE